jgi:6,7-dimethyl-8-ribityllumazine synthase
MALYQDNASLFNPQHYPNAAHLKIGIVKAQWNSQVTDLLQQGAIQALQQCMVPQQHITQITVPGSYELTAGAQWLFQNHALDAVIALGCVIQGETPHFDFICHAVANGLNQVTLKFGKPVIFGVLTTLNLQQALDRCGGSHGHKGSEAALTAITMALLQSNASPKIGF